MLLKYLITACQPVSIMPLSHHGSKLCFLGNGVVTAAGTVGNE